MNGDGAVDDGVVSRRIDFSGSAADLMAGADADEYDTDCALGTASGRGDGAFRGATGLEVATPAWLSVVSTNQIINDDLFHYNPASCQLSSKFTMNTSDATGIVGQLNPSC
jgi:hypothetical protein